MSILGEAWRASKSQPALTSLALLVYIGLSSSLMLTTGQSVATERELLQKIDARGTDTVAIYADPAAGLTASTVLRIEAFEDITGVIAVGPATDAVWSLRPFGEVFAFREAFVSDSIWRQSSVTGGATMLPRAAEISGVTSPQGQIVTKDGTVAPFVAVSESLDSIETTGPTAVKIMRASDHRDAVITQLVVAVASPEVVDRAIDDIRAVLGASDPSMVRIEASADLVELRSLTSEDLRAARNQLAFGVGAVGAGLSLAIYTAVVMLRRKEFGRRRAIGATQSYVLALLEIQAVSHAMLGSVVGFGGSATLLWFTNGPIAWSLMLPSLAVAVSAASLGSLLPALVAAVRDPVREVRVP